MSTHLAEKSRAREPWFRLVSVPGPQSHAAVQRCQLCQAVCEHAPAKQRAWQRAKKRAVLDQTHDNDDVSILTKKNGLQKEKRK